MKRIYDAAFAVTNGSHHSHLGTFWWIDSDGSKGVWTREQAYNYVLAHREQVYVREGTSTVYVYAYHYTNDPSVKWIQTEADGIKKDNLTTLAQHHAQGLPNL